MYRYYGAPAVAFRQGGLAKHHLGAGEASQAPAVSAAQAAREGTGALTPYDSVSGQHHAQVAAVKAPNAMAPAAEATVMHHTEMNAQFGHPLPRKSPRKFVKKIPKVVQPTTCEVCKIQLTALHDLRNHEKGKKHKKNLEKLQDTTPKQENPPNGAVGASTAPAAADSVMPAAQSKRKKSSATTLEDLEVKKRRVLEAGTAQGEPKICTMSNVVKVVHCEVCKIQCTTLDNLRGHERGKKHKKNLEKLQDSIISEPAKAPNDAVGATTEPGSAAVPDDVTPAVQPKKNKKRRLIEAKAAEGEFKPCTMCNVVAVNQEAYEEHIAGNKHKAKLQKQQQAQLPHVA